jgi:hypothetical protein
VTRAGRWVDDHVAMGLVVAPAPVVLVVLVVSGGAFQRRRPV